MITEQVVKTRNQSAILSVSYNDVYIHNLIDNRSFTLK